MPQIGLFRSSTI